MRAAGRVVAGSLAAVATAARPGVSLAELDELAADLIADAGAKLSFLDYHPSWAPTPYPAVLCLSVNDAVVHGIPDRRVLAEGDLLSIDCGAHVAGYHGDAAVTSPTRSRPWPGAAGTASPMGSAATAWAPPCTRIPRYPTSAGQVTAADGSRAAHAEHTIAVTADRPVILTAP